MSNKIEDFLPSATIRTKDKKCTKCHMQRVKRQPLCLYEYEQIYRLKSANVLCKECWLKHKSRLFKCCSCRNRAKWYWMLNECYCEECI